MRSAAFSHRGVPVRREEALAYNPNPSDAERFRVLQSAAACPVQRSASGAHVCRRELQAPPNRCTSRPLRTTGWSSSGASLAGLTAAETLRVSGFTGTVTVVGDEPHLPYDRPPLSKQVLTGIADTTTTQLPHAADLDIDWRRGHPGRLLGHGREGGGPEQR